ncbi:MAG TPA: hypothetical protein VK116_12425 [Planctomycetota bacterium]|nr:hypothetical protein [Planctomycetota bacterium]
MRRVVAALFATSLLAAIVFVSLAENASRARAAAPVAPAPAAYKPAIDTANLMEAVDMNFSELKKELETLSDRKARSAALKRSYLLAELMNVLPHFESEEVKGEAKRKKWEEISHSIRDEFLKLAPAIKESKSDVKTVYSKIEATCESCHDMRE